LVKYEAPVKPQPSFKVRISIKKQIIVVKALYASLIQVLLKL